MEAIRTLQEGTKEQYGAGAVKAGYAKATFAGPRSRYEVNFYTARDVINAKMAEDGAVAFFQRPISRERSKERWRSVLGVGTTVNVDELLVAAESRVRRDGFAPNGLAILTYHFYPSHKADKTGREETKVFFEVADSQKASVVRFEGDRFAAHGRGTIIQFPSIKLPEIKIPTFEPIQVNLPASAGGIVESYVNEEGETLLRIEDDFLFDFDSDEPRPDAVPLFRSLAGVVNEKNPSKVFVEGHTDSWGTPVYNDDLSNRRAQAIAALLAAAGVSDALLEVNGHGETRPVAAETHADGTDDPEGRQKNRRVEVRLR
jgi:outer membrane protein OmpA-like peptidoglycan-associated protein